MAACTRCASRSMWLQKSSLRATTISAAADGVGARRSATKSAIVTSVSWPTAEIVGTGQPAIARATTSSLNAHRSSIEPPPRPTMTTSTPGTLSDRGHRPRDVERRAFALDARGTNDDVRVRVAPAQHLDDVADGGAVERRDDPDLPRQRRQRTLAARVEQAGRLRAAASAVRTRAAGRRVPRARGARRRADTRPSGRTR